MRKDNGARPRGVLPNAALFGLEIHGMERSVRRVRVFALILLVSGIAMILTRAFRPVWRTDRLPGVVLLIPSDVDAPVIHVGNSDALWIDSPAGAETVTEFRMRFASTHRLAALLERRCNSIITSSYRVTDPDHTDRVLRVTDFGDESSVELDDESVRRAVAYFAGWANTSLLVEHVRRRGLSSECDVVAGPTAVLLGIGLVGMAVLLWEKTSAESSETEPDTSE